MHHISRHLTAGAVALCGSKRAVVLALAGDHAEVAPIEVVHEDAPAFRGDVAVDCLDLGIPISSAGLVVRCGKIRSVPVAGQVALAKVSPVLLARLRAERARVVATVAIEAKPGSIPCLLLEGACISRGRRIGRAGLS